MSDSTGSIYYQDDFATLYLGDCLTQTAWLDADVLCTDPPYGVGGQLSRGGTKGGYRPHKEFGTQEWDKTLEVRNLAIEAWRKDGVRPSAIFASPRRLDDLPPYRQMPLIWDKGDTVGMGDTTFPWRPTYELIFVDGSGWHGHRGESVIRARHLASDATRIGHPTPKPIGLMEAIIQKAPPGVIADPFAGSGSTLVAAKLLGRKSVGVELEEKYCEIAARRLSQGVLDFGDWKGNA